VGLHVTQRAVSRGKASQLWCNHLAKQPLAVLSSPGHMGTSHAGDTQFNKLLRQADPLDLCPVFGGASRR
jgi:hypothetical protein